MPTTAKRLIAPGLSVALGVVGALALTGGVPSAEALPVHQVKLGINNSSTITASAIVSNVPRARTCFGSVQGALFLRKGRGFRRVAATGFFRARFRPCRTGAVEEVFNTPTRGLPAGTYRWCVTASGRLRSGAVSKHTTCGKTFRRTRR